MDTKRHAMDQLKAELGWSLVKMTQGNIDKHDAILKLNKLKIETSKKTIEKNTEKQRQLKIEKV